MALLSRAGKLLPPALKRYARTIIEPGSWRYRWLARNAARPQFNRASLIAEGYNSQCGQDKWVVETLLPQLAGGVFVDIGANDGISFSNTLFLEKELRWTGVAVEPIREVFDRLKINRTCVAVNGCVARHSGMQKFQVISGYAEMLSGLVEEYDPRHKHRIQGYLASDGGTVREIEMQCFALSDLLKANGISSVDYLSIDVEGAEYSILEGIDWPALDVKVISVENAYKDYRIPLLLSRKGFELHSIVGDEFYIRAEEQRAGGHY